MLFYQKYYNIFFIAFIISLYFDIRINYNYTGDYMKIYVDLLFLLNIGLDFILLTSISVILKRNVKLKRLITGSIFGSMTIIFLFIKLNSWQMLIIKIILGFLMVIITFGYKDIRYTFNNFYYLIVNSIIMGGGLYLIKDYGYYNYIILIIGFIVIMYIYLQQMKKYHLNYSNYAKVDIYLNKRQYKFNGYLDTGNNLYDQFKHRPVILISESIPYNDEDVLYVSCNTINKTSLIKCLKPDKVIINNKVYNNLLIGISPNEFKIDGINCILHNSLRGEL